MKAAGEKSPTQPLVDAAIAWELVERLEEALPYIDEGALERDIDLSIENFKFAVAK